MYLCRQMYETKAGGRQSGRVLGRQTRYQGQRLVEEGGCSRMRCPNQHALLGHQDALFNDEQVETNMREAWEHEGSKDELNIVLQGLEQQFWKGTEAGWMGCYDLPWRNLGGGWIGKQRRYGGRERLLSTTWSQPCSSSGKRGGGGQFTKTGTRCDSPFPNFKKRTTGKNRLPQPGQLSSYLETAKAENS
jgi:hypothetical protein